MITFEYPAYTEAVSSIELRNPERNDDQGFQQEIITLEARDGSKYRFTQPQYRSNNVVYETQLVFRNIDTTKLRELRTFLANAAGEYVKYTDYDDDTWVFFFARESFSERTTHVGRYTLTFDIMRWSA